MHTPESLLVLSCEQLRMIASFVNADITGIESNQTELVNIILDAQYQFLLEFFSCNPKGRIAHAKSIRYSANTLRSGLNNREVHLLHLPANEKIDNPINQTILDETRKVNRAIALIEKAASLLEDCQIAKAQVLTLGEATQLITSKQAKRMLLTKC
ncbi:hypothetical protein Cylst_0732 [Cylindrospermum stagnale PCC 7417]|uniref:Uncharacterized protein n=2 Tax=Cylindrospermum stagnale TaxID=142864 RepID=K9WTF6_9NOST|nr:hypothetical protein Cylst_0732 [Cylindrospermum stagnale PCC 7417]